WIIDLNDTTSTLMHIDTICAKLRNNPVYVGARDILIVADSNQLDTALMLADKWRAAVLERDIYTYLPRTLAMFSEVHYFDNDLRRCQFADDVAIMENDQYTFLKNANISNDSIFFKGQGLDTVLIQSDSMIFVF